MKAIKLILLIVTIILLSNSVLVECITLNNDKIKNDINDHDKAALSEADLDSIATIATTDTSLTAIYNKFLTRKDEIKEYLTAATPASGKAPSDRNDPAAGRKAILLLLAAFETIKPDRITDKTGFTQTEKDPIINAILDIAVNSPDKTAIHTLLTTSTSNPVMTFTAPIVGAKAKYNLVELLGAAHRLRLHLPDPIDAQATDNGIRAIGRLTVLINELIPQTEDYEEISLALAREIVTDKKAALFHYTTKKDVLLELDREYTWKKTLLDLRPASPRTSRTLPSDTAVIADIDNAYKQLQDQYKILLPPAIKKTQEDFKATTDSRKLSFAILSHSLKQSDMNVAAVKAERKRMDDQLGMIPATDAAEAKLAIEEAFLYAMLDATNYAGDPNTPLQPAEKTKDREPAIHDAMNIRRLHLQTKYKEILDNPTKENSATKVKDKTKELKDKQIAFAPKTDNDDDLNNAIDEAIKKIQNAEIQLFPPNPPQNPATQPSPTGGGGGAPASGNPRIPEVVKELEEMEFNNNPPLKVPADQCTDAGSNCGDIVRMCIIPAYVIRMHQNCRRTCRVCFPEGEPCQDQFPDCQMWKDGGYCTSRIPKALKMMQCPVTCGLCP